MRSEGQQRPPRSTLALADAAKAQERKGTDSASLHRQILTPQPLIATSPLANTGRMTVANPTKISAYGDNSFLVVDAAGPAWCVWPDGSELPREFSAATFRATAMQAAGDGFLVAESRKNRVERFGGNITWKREDLPMAHALAVMGETVFALLLKDGARSLVRLSLATGETLSVVEDGGIMTPVAIAVGVSGELAVVDIESQEVHYFNEAGVHLRKLGVGRLDYVSGFAVDVHGRLYLADRHSNNVVVLDGTTGTQVATIALPGYGRGVAVNASGTVVVGHRGPTGVAVAIVPLV